MEEASLFSHHKNKSPRSESPRGLMKLIGPRNRGSHPLRAATRESDLYLSCACPFISWARSSCSSSGRLIRAIPLQIRKIRTFPGRHKSGPNIRQAKNPQTNAFTSMYSRMSASVIVRCVPEDHPREHRVPCVLCPSRLATGTDTQRTLHTPTAKSGAPDCFPLPAGT